MKKSKIKYILLLTIILIGIFSICGFAENFHWKCIIPANSSYEINEWRALSKEIEEVTEGQMVIDIYVPGEHPYKLADTLKAISTGEIEIAGIIPGYVSGIEPGLSVLDLPLFIPEGSFEIYRELYTELRKGYFKDLLEKWNAREIFSAFMSGQNYYLKDGWIENSESLKGKKMRSWSTEVSNFIKLMGGVPVTLAFNENYTALQTGLLDGTTTNFNSAYNAKFFDICKHVVMAQVSFSTDIYVVNIDAWNKLPADLQETLTNIFESRRDDWETANFKRTGEVLQLAFVEYGIEAKPIPKEYRKELTEGAYEAIWKPWLKRAGESAEEAFEQIVEQIQELGYEVPIK